MSSSTNDLLDLELEAGGTQFAANQSSQIAFATLFDGDAWMIYQNVVTKVLHWDFVRPTCLFCPAFLLISTMQSALGRFISFPVIDSQCVSSALHRVRVLIILKERLRASRSISQKSQTWDSNGLLIHSSTFQNRYRLLQRMLMQQNSKATGCSMIMITW